MSDKITANASTGQIIMSWRPHSYEWLILCCRFMPSSPFRILWRRKRNIIGVNCEWLIEMAELQNIKRWTKWTFSVLSVTILVLWTVLQIYVSSRPSLSHLTNSKGEVCGEGENWGSNIWQKLRWQNMAEKVELAKAGAKRRADDVWQWSLKDGKGVCNEEAHRKQHHL